MAHGDVRNATKAFLRPIIGTLSLLAIMTHIHIDRTRTRYIMSLAVADWSGQAWLQGFNDVGLAVFGMSANELIEIKVGFLLACAQLC
jgi:hypothetical protein